MGYIIPHVCHGPDKEAWPTDWGFKIFVYEILYCISCSGVASEVTTLALALPSQQQ
jgi:hypothetical protein